MASGRGPSSEQQVPSAARWTVLGTVLRESSLWVSMPLIVAAIALAYALLSRRHGDHGVTVYTIF